MSKPALGRGLGALLGSSPVTSKPAGSIVTPESPPTAPPEGLNRERVQQVTLSQVHPCPLQPRKDFTPESLQELASSIRENGIVQPLIVRQGASGLELIAGERRWRAARLVGLETVPVIVREADDRTVLELALIENLQRENLNPIEEAQGYSQLVGQFQLTQEEVAKRVGKSRAAVANALRLLRLEPGIQALVREGRLSVGHAKVILGLDDVAQQRKAAERAVKDALNVRQTEGLVARMQQSPARETSPRLAPKTDAHVSSLEGRIRDRVGTKVRLNYKAGKGRVEISFFSDDELERILQLLGVGAD
jgi:ParB family chromosome partitioning protein